MIKSDPHHPWWSLKALKSLRVSLETSSDVDNIVFTNAASLFNVKSSNQVNFFLEKDFKFIFCFHVKLFTH